MIRLGIRNLPKIGFHSTTSQIQQIAVKTLNLQSKLTSIEFVRNTTFFNKLNAEAIIKSVITVSNAGRKRGRGKSARKKAIGNLNKGQQIGIGKINIRWPGLNSPILQGQDIVQLEKLPADPDYEKKLLAARNLVVKKKIQAIHPLERGWSGRSLLGKSLGPPSILENKEGFDSYMLETKYLKLTHSKLGKVRSLSAFVVVGNRKGIIGISSAKAADLKGAIKKAQSRASRKLFTVPLEEGHTVNHDFFYQFGITKLFVYKRPPNSGLVCHRAIMICCELLGIKDLYTKIEGSRNKQNVVKAFLLGLLEQKSYQQMADENKLHLVEQRNETYMFPKVLASPSEVAKQKDHSLIFEQYIMNGKLTLKREKMGNSVIAPNYVKFLKKTNYSRNHKEVRLRLKAEYGGYTSYLSDIYPECQPMLPRTSKHDSTKDSDQ